MFLELFSKPPTTKCDAPESPPLPPLTPPPPPPSDTTSTPPPPTTPKDTIAEAASAVSPFPNPGPYEQATLDTKRLTSLDTYDGFRIDISKQLSPFMAAVHSFWLGTTMIPDGRNKTYNFVTQVADESGLLMARVDPERGSVDGRIHRAMPFGMAKLTLGASTEGSQDQLLGELDFGGGTWMGNLKYGTMGGGIMYGCNYFQSVTKNLALGGEGMYVGANGALMSSYMLKYTMKAPGDEEGGEKGEKEGHSTIVANFNTGQGLVTLNYKRLVTPNRVTLGAELQASPMTLDSQVVFGAEVNFQRSKMNVCVDGSGKIQSLLEAKLGITPGSPTLTFSAEMDHLKDSMRFGYGLNIGG